MDAWNTSPSHGGASAAVEQYADVPLFARHGRLGRVRYIAYSAAAFAMFTPMFVVSSSVAAVAASGETSAIPLAPIYLLSVACVIVFGLVLAVRRCHDFDASGWLAIIALVPLLGMLLWVIPGTRGRNRFGLQPRPPSIALMLVLLIPTLGIGASAVVAIPAYVEYIDNANMAKVEAHFEEGARFAANEMHKWRTMRALGMNATLPESAEGWIAELNPTAVLAPDGAPAYVPQSALTRGSPSIGVAVIGEAASGTLVVTLRRNAYLDLPADVRVIRLTERQAARLARQAP